MTLFNHSELKWFAAEWPDVNRDQLYAFTKLRIAVFIVEQNCPYQEFDDKDPKAIHLWAEDHSGTVHAYLRILPPGVSYPETSIGRVATSADWRSIGLGRELMRRGMNEVRNRQGEVAVRISAQSYLLKFYRDFGFISLGEEYLEDGIPHTEMCYTP